MSPRAVANGRPLARRRVLRVRRGAAAAASRLSPPQRLAPALWGWAIIASCFGLTSCGGGEPPPLDEIERLAFVPAGRGVSVNQVVWGAPEDLLVDRFEVTRDQWRRWWAERPREPGASLEPWQFLGATGLPAERVANGSARDDELAREGRRELEGHLPASSMTLELARAFARDTGMRLPTAAEWMHVASGQRALRYPWGPLSRESSANTLELGLNRPLPVGTFENGRTAHGIHDLVGNVWEWVEAPAERAATIELEAALAFEDDAWIMGGSWAWRTHPLYAARDAVLFARAVGPRTRSADIGFRRVVEARTYLLARAQELSRADLRKRLIFLGERWGDAAIGLLEGLCADPNAPVALRWLLLGAQR